MHTVGQRKPSPISFAASSTARTEGARFNDEIHRLPGGSDGFIPKGVCRFTTHDEANRQQQDCLDRAMARVALMLNACGETYDSLQQYAEVIDLDGIPVRTINPQGLLLTLQTRDKDIADRIVLEQAPAVLGAHPARP